jgi:hypothetical protein
MRRRRSSQVKNGILVVAAAVSLLATGCGGSEHPPASGSAARAPGRSRSTHSEERAATSRLIASADAICRRFNKELTGASRPQASKVARTAPRNAALEQRAVAELSKLTPPASLARDWKQIIAYRRTLAEELVTLARDAKADNVQGMQALAASKKRVHDELTKLAAHDGFTDCSSVGTANIGKLFPTLRPAARPSA